MRKLYTEEEIVVCTYIARFGRGLNEKDIVRIQNRSERSIKMKIQNIASMLKEEGFKISDKISPLTGLTTGQKGRKTNWNIVEPLATMPKNDLFRKCTEILNKNRFKLA